MRSRLALIAAVGVVGACGTEDHHFIDAHAPSTVESALDSTGNMAAPRRSHTAAILADGSVLVAGGATAYPNDSSTSTAERYSPSTNAFTATGSLGLPPRGDHGSAILNDGRVLVVGGYTEWGTPDELASALLYDPATGAWAPTGSMSVARRQAMVHRLPDGRVLVAGGYAFNAGPFTDIFASAEIFDPATGAFTPTGSMSQGRAAAASASLGDGRVLVAGGFAQSGPVQASAELYDPSTGTWSATGALAGPRVDHVAVTLADGRVLVAGGTSGGWPPAFVLDAELYDPSTGTFAIAGSMSVARADAAAIELADGDVLVTGGATSGTGMVPVTASMERWDVDTGTWSNAGNMNKTRVYHSMTLLADGRVLIVGGALDGGPNEASSGATATGELYTGAPPCAPPVLTPASATFPHAGGSSGFTVSAADGCAWTVTGAPFFMTITSGASGSGNGSISYTVAANGGPARQATLIVGGNDGAAEHTVSQEASPCAAAPVITPASASFAHTGGAGGFSVTHPAGCPWNLGSVPSWITLTSASSGTGNGSVSYTVAVNGGGARNATLYVNPFGPATHVVSQQATPCTSPPVLTPSSASFPHAGGAGSFDVAVAAGCPWFVGAVPSWITLTSGSSGSGNGTVGYSVAANGGNGRNATLSVSASSGASTHAVSQQASPCAALPVVTPASASFAHTGGAGGFSVAHVAGCAWSVVGVPSWITLTSSASGSGNGNVTYAVAANSSAARNATLFVTSVSAAAHAVSQQAAPPPPGSQFPAGPNATYSSTYRTVGCGWPSTSCNSLGLVNGRRTLGPEPNHPNTLTATCADGAYGTYHSDESLDAVRVTSTSGGNIVAGASVTVAADVWAYVGYSSDKLDIFVTDNADAASPVWTLVTTKTPTKAGASTISHTFNLPASSSPRLAVRVQFRYGGSATACATGGYNDRDDVVLEVAVP